MDLSVDEEFECELKSLIENRGRKYDILLHKCYFCDTEFLAVKHLNLHLKKHHKKNNFDCKFCKISFVNKHIYLNHLVDEHQVKMEFKCNFCEDKIGHFGAFRQHRQEHWEEKGLIAHTCEYCQEGFTNLKKMKIHQRSHKIDEDINENDR